MRRPVVVIALALGALLVRAPLAAAPAPVQAQDFQVIVNAANARASIGKADLARIFLRKTRAWPGGGKVEPVDQSEDAAVRQAFSREVLDKDVAAVKSYWQQQVFTGKGAPLPVHAGDAAVIAFVGGNADAIGYVAAGAALPASVKAIKVVP